MKPGILYIVSTPIGNLRDITLRALDVLKSVDLIASEDTRRTRILLQHYDINRPLLSYYTYNKQQRTASIVHALKEGKSVALVSEAGTPCVSDPGYFLIHAVIEEGLQVMPIPGPSALLAAIAVAGLPVDRFIFEGFLPAKKGRQKRLRELAQEKRSIILFEGPHRIIRLLKEILEAMENRRVMIGREMTKMYEEFFRGTVSDALTYFSAAKVRGEFVIIVEGQTHNGFEN